MYNWRLAQVINCHASLLFVVPIGSTCDARFFVLHVAFSEVILCCGCWHHRGTEACTLQFVKYSTTEVVLSNGLSVFNLGISPASP